MVEELQRHIEKNRIEKGFLREQLKELSPIATVVASVTAVPLDMSRHAIERQSRLADGLWQSLKELEIELQSPSRVTLQQLASLPQSASHSRQIRAAGVVGSGDGLLIALLVGYLEWRDCRVRSPLDITSRTFFRCLERPAISQEDTLLLRRHATIAPHRSGSAKHSRIFSCEDRIDLLADLSPVAFAAVGGQRNGRD